MSETQKRIQAYKKSLPHMKERVVAAIMLLAIALTMVVSASFAWTTLSINPEISGLATTIAANGNLEIALSGIDGLEPGKTQIGDGLGDITETNLRWGNLVNLSHESYGLDYLTLRPASLNTEALDVSPMIAVNYGQDGRVQGYLKDFAFSNYNASAKVFDVFDTTRYGVRAISSVTYSNAHAQSFYNGQLDKVTESMQNAKQRFSSIYGNSTYMNTVTALVGIHVSAMMGEDISCLSYMPNLNKIMDEMEAVRDLTGQAIVDIANLYLYDELSDAGQAGSYESLAYELEDISANNYSNDFTRKYGTKIKGLTNYVNMAKRVDDAAAQMALASSTEDGDVLWQRDLKKAVTYMCNVDKATIKTSEGEYTCAQLAGSKSIAVKILLSGETPMAIIKEGALKDADQLLGTELFVENVKVGVTLPDDFGYGMGGRTVSITCNVQTNATAPYDLPNAYNDAYAFSSGATAGDRGTPVAADTYAMAIDFWVRTNEANALLMLEGEVQYREEREAIMVYNADGEQVPLHEVLLTTTDENGETVEITVDVYQGTDDQDRTVWYNASTDEVVDVGSSRPTQKYNVTKIPIGYSGVNRIWEELDDPNSDYSQMIQDGTSTTQGSGSCYIFYPETPEDQEQCKNLLAAMHVAFIDEHGNLLGYGDMDVDSMIEDAGRVIVPLKTRIQKQAIIVGQDSNGKNITETSYITPLVQNEAMRITAIVYLDGQSLSNSDVLSAGSINGQLNIQFGLNKMENSPLKDGPLMGEYYSVTADLVNKATGELAKRDDSVDFYNKDTCVWEIQVGIAGTNASSVRGQFVSYINASQGTRQQEFHMTYDSEKNRWVALVPFSGPGEFRLRSIQIDGVDTLLPAEQVLYVVIPGKSVSSLVCTNWGGDGSAQSVMTADAIYKQEVHLVLNSGDSAISKVQGVFIGEGKNITVDFTTDAGVNYVGNATFTNGGTYTMTYVIIDGVYTPLDPSLCKTLTLKLNLKTTINLGLPLDDGYYELIRERDAAMGEATGADRDLIAAQYQERINAYLNTLHYGTGIVGDRNQNGLNLVRDANGNMSFVTDCSEPLYFDIRCIITDDQGNMLTNLRDVEILYSAGGVSNKLDCDALQVDTNAGYYAGRLTLESNGMFSFNTLTFKEVGSDKVYTIYGSSSAPTITAIQPAPMEYVTQGAYAPYVYDLGMNASERVLYIKLKNAAAASLDVTLTNGKGETAAPVAVVAGEQDSRGVTTFAIQVPADGYWQITSVRAKNVFYNDVFYTGQPDDPTTWLDLSQQALDDEIATHFVTEAYIRANGNTPAQSYTGAFMTPHEVTGMNVEVLGSQYGERMPLEQILESIGIDAEVSFALQYALDLNTLNGSYTYSGTLPTYEFNSTYDEAGHKANMGTMNFLLPGTYYPRWSVTIDAVNDAYDYSYSYRFGTEKASEFTYLNTTSMESVVMVSWNQIPVVTVSAISPNGSHTTATSSLGLAWSNKTVTSSIAADQFSATVYPGIQKDGTLGMKVVTYPYATLKISNMGNATGATMTFANAKFYTSSSASQNNSINYYEWSESDTCQRYLGYYSGGRWSGTSKPTGSVSSSQVLLKYGDMTFTFTLANTVTIHNNAAS